MKRLKGQKGFTLAELLIVVAIIGVLVAIAVPVFNSQLDKAREATDKANVRSAVAEVTAAYLSENTEKKIEITAQSKTTGGKNNGWVGEAFAINNVPITKAETYNVSCSDQGVVKVNDATIDTGSGAATPKKDEDTPS